MWLLCGRGCYNWNRKLKCNLKCLSFRRSLSYDADFEDYVVRYSALLLVVVVAVFPMFFCNDSTLHASDSSAGSRRKAHPSEADTFLGIKPFQTTIYRKR